jgi:hypothetical protein
MSDRLNIVTQAIAGMPSPVQQEAHQVTLLAAAGHGSVEIARRMNTTSPQVEQIRGSIGSAVVGALRTEGYSPGEISRTLGIPTPMDATNAQATQASSTASPARHRSRL